MVLAALHYLCCILEIKNI